jgi:hypothetical protein
MCLYFLFAFCEPTEAAVHTDSYLKDSYRRVRVVMAQAKDETARLDFDNEGALLGCYIGKDAYHGFIFRHKAPVDDMTLADLDLSRFSNPKNSLVPLPGAALCLLVGLTGSLALQRKNFTASA